MKPWFTFIAVALASLASSAQAAGPVKTDRPAVLKSILDCRARTADAERLACYDAAVAAMNRAETAGDVIIIDRQQAQAARRQAFGLDLSALTIFDRGEERSETERVVGEVASAHQGRDGRWTVVLADGAVWRQIDDQSVSKGPRKGSNAEIRRAAMGSYFMKLDGQRAIRARRADTQ